MSENSKRILVISSADTTDSIEMNDGFVARLNQQLDHHIQIEWHNYHQIGLEFNTGHLRAFLIENNTDLNSFDFVYFKSYFQDAEQAASIAEYLQEVNVPFVCSELKDYIPQTKLTQLARLARAGLPIPKSVFLPHEMWLSHYEQVQRDLGSPFIFKAIDARGGNSNFLIDTRQAFEKVLSENQELIFVAQTFIANSSDLRVLIIDKQIQLVIRRQRKDNSTHLNNTSQGGNAEILPLHELAPESQAMALQAAALMKREIAGVDVMFEDGTGDPYILEVNASPQVATGAFIDEKLKIYGNFFTNVLK